MDRAPIVAGMFYPAGEAACRREVRAYLQATDPEPLPRPLVAGLVPHAGWAYSAQTAAHVYALLQGLEEPPETVVLFGAVHTWGVTHPALYATGAWRTPVGAVNVDEELAARLLAAAGPTLVADPAAHQNEHAIEVQLPFLHEVLPAARILPIATPPTREAAQAGRAAALAAREVGRRVVAIGSTDLTHYGPRYGITPVGVGVAGLEWTRENDARLLDLALEAVAAPEAEGRILGEVQAHHNACGAGAIVATIAFAREMGAEEGRLLHYTTSYDVLPDGAPADLVGYGAIAYF